MSLQRLASVVPPIVLTISFAFAVLTTASKHWVTRTNFSLDDPPVNQGQLYRSPFVSCGSTPVTPPNGSTPYYIVECFRRNVPGHSCQPFAGDNPALCQQLTVTGRLLITGCIFAGFAFILSWFVLGTRLMPSSKTAARRGNHAKTEEGTSHKKADPSPSTSRSTSRQSFFTITLFSFAIIAAVSIAIAELIGGNALLNLQPPNGEFSNTANAVDIRAGWTVDKAITYATVSWIFAAFGAFVVDLVWRLPRGVGVSCDYYEPITTAQSDPAVAEAEDSPKE